MKLTVTVLDTTGIQPYIFGSNRLRENVGGSYLVGEVTEQWVRDILRSAPFEVSDCSLPIATSGQAAEVVYMGGGNTVLLFVSEALAQQFIRLLSSKVLRNAPGISLIAAHRHNFDTERDSLRDTIREMKETDLFKKKRSRIPSSPLLGLGVTQDCLSTRLVAVDTSNNHGSPDTYPVSREIAAKLDVVKSKGGNRTETQSNAANEALKKVIFDSQVPNQWDIPLDFDDFGRSEGDMSYIAVVHIDGNSMGQRFQACGEKDEAGYQQAIRQLSESVKKAGQDSLRELTLALVDAMPRLSGMLDLKPKKLPFRPLVYGGDDVTFVCDGRLGLSLAAHYLELFSQKKASDGEALSACAGVCIVKTHYPFARAYALSEQLCASAKKVAKYKRSTQTERAVPLSAIDWHIATSGLLGSLIEIRQREYQSQTGDSLAMRPLILGEQDFSYWQTWENAVHLFKKFKRPEWQSKRNKIVGLREVLRTGKSATQEFLTAYQLDSLPTLPESVSQDVKTDLESTGWRGGTCGYFDVIEALDFYTSLGGEE